MTPSYTKKSLWLHSKKETKKSLMANKVFLPCVINCLMLIIPTHLTACLLSHTSLQFHKKVSFFSFSLCKTKTHSPSSLWQPTPSPQTHNMKSSLNKWPISLLTGNEYWCLFLATTQQPGAGDPRDTRPGHAPWPGADPVPRWFWHAGTEASWQPGW